MLEKIFLSFTVFLGLLYASSVYALEDWEKILMEKGCHNYSDQKVDNKYLMCLIESIKATGSGSETIHHSGVKKNVVYACGSDNMFRTCEIELINSKGYSVLSLSIYRDLRNPIKSSFFTSATLNELSLGDSCSCEVKKWAIETQDSKIYGRGLWYQKESTPIFDAIDKASSLQIYAVIPNEKKRTYRADFEATDIEELKNIIGASINYLHDGKK